jgi:SIR2-like domain
MPEFLALFDAIFTLNQDLLPETQYLNRQRVDLSLIGNRRWMGGVLPGTEEILNPAGGLYDPLTVLRRPVASPRNTPIDPRMQPLFKLHGSMNWQDPNGDRLLVMGGNKPTTMQRHPILMWYADKFLEMLSRPHTRLMVIGYGFGDDHINRLVREAWVKGNQTSQCSSCTRMAGTYSKRSTRRTGRGTSTVEDRLRKLPPFTIRLARYPLHSAPIRPNMKSLLTTRATRGSRCSTFL